MVPWGWDTQFPVCLWLVSNNTVPPIDDDEQRCAELSRWAWGHAAASVHAVAHLLLRIVVGIGVAVAEEEVVGGVGGQSSPASVGAGTDGDFAKIRNDNL